MKASRALFFLVAITSVSGCQLEEYYKKTIDSLGISAPKGDPVVIEPVDAFQQVSIKRDDYSNAIVAISNDPEANRNVTALISRANDNVPEAALAGYYELPEAFATSVMQNTYSYLPDLPIPKNVETKKTTKLASLAPQKSYRPLPKPDSFGRKIAPEDTLQYSSPLIIASVEGSTGKVNMVSMAESGDTGFSIASDTNYLDEDLFN